MGRKKSIVFQAVDRLKGMAAFGQSKHADKLINNGKPALEKIYSYSTMQNYVSASVSFAKWARKKFNCKNIDEARQYVKPYLEQRMNEGKSAWTLKKDISALSKLYQCKSSDFGISLPKRKRNNITQHRENKSAGHFSIEKNRDLVDFCKATGLRRHEVASIRPADISVSHDGKILVHVIGGKGGKNRTVTALNDTPLRLAKIANEAGRNKLFNSIPKYAPIHEYRRFFANEMYNRIARDIGQLDKSETYICRSDKYGDVYDRKAMKEVSEALGHSRIDVIATNYLK